MLKRTILYAVTVILLSGCAGFKEKYNPAEGAWSTTKGENTLAVSAYSYHKNYPIVDVCDEYVVNARLYPDTAYFRDWMRLQDSNAYFVSKPPKEADQETRIAPRVIHCSFIFQHLPAGHWIFLGNLKHSVTPHKVTVILGQQGSITELVTSTQPIPIWARITLDETGKPSFLKVGVDSHARSSEGQVSPWTPTTDEMKAINDYIKTGYTISPWAGLIQ